jgi:hypothetical protein
MKNESQKQIVIVLQVQQVSSKKNSVDRMMFCWTISGDLHVNEVLTCNS